MVVDNRIIDVSVVDEKQLARADIEQAIYELNSKIEMLSSTTLNK